MMLIFFLREEQLQEEIQGCLGLVKLVFSVLGMSEYRVRVSLRDPDSDKYVGCRRLEQSGRGS